MLSGRFGKASNEFPFTTWAIPQGVPLVLGIVRGAKSSAISYDHIARYCRLQSAADSDRVFKVPESLCSQALVLYSSSNVEVHGRLSGGIAPWPYQNTALRNKKQ